VQRSIHFSSILAFHNAHTVTVTRAESEAWAVATEGEVRLVTLHMPPSFSKSAPGFGHPPNSLGDFTFWLSPWLRLKAETKHESKHSTLVLVQTED